MKIRTILFVCLCTLLGCSKTGTNTNTGNTTPTTPITPAIPTVSSPQQKVWTLKTMFLEGINIPLTATQANFQMILYDDGRYQDTDGMAGTWHNSTQDSLIIAKTNLPTPITLRYKIVLQTVSQLMLKRNTTDHQISLLYEAR